LRPLDRGGASRTFVWSCALVSVIEWGGRWWQMYAPRATKPDGEDGSV